MKTYPFRQVDVFGRTRLKGNPLAAVINADGLSDETMHNFARWTNLSETIFLQTPTHPQADYKVRIFTPSGELPFAGHPTLGAAWIWLTATGSQEKTTLIQECRAGLIHLQHHQGQLSFMAPPLVKAGVPEPAEVDSACAALGISPAELVACQWVDNGPGWMGILVATEAQLAAIQPDYARQGNKKVGVCAIKPGGKGLEVRAFCGPIEKEDPVTGSLNASLAQWLTKSGYLPGDYQATQGTAVGSDGVIQIHTDSQGIWVGGTVVEVIRGEIQLG